tara:strand:+ start:3347 stop:4267 length:921 start_codon:yes stop_codon:yes gene_type:complete
LPALQRGARALRGARLYFDRRFNLPRITGPDTTPQGILLGLLHKRALDANVGEIMALAAGGTPRFGSLAGAYRAHTGGAMLWDDFPGTVTTNDSIGTLPWYRTRLGSTNATLTKVANTATAQRGGLSFGVARATTADTNDTGSAYHIGTFLNPLMNGPPVDNTWCVAKLSLPLLAVNGHHWAGLWSHHNREPDIGTSNVISGIGWRAAPGGSAANWFGVVRNDTTESTVDLGVAADTTVRELAWSIQSSRVQFYVNGAAVGSVVTANLPDAGYALNLVWGVRTTDTNATTMDIDYIGLFLPTGNRW